MFLIIVLVLGYPVIPMSDFPWNQLMILYLFPESSESNIGRLLMCSLCKTIVIGFQYVHGEVMRILNVVAPPCLVLAF